MVHGGLGGKPQRMAISHIMHRSKAFFRTTRPTARTQHKKDHRALMTVQLLTMLYAHLRKKHAENLGSGHQQIRRQRESNWSRFVDAKLGAALPPMERNMLVSSWIDVPLQANHKALAAQAYNIATRQGITKADLAKRLENRRGLLKNHKAVPKD
eukprot:TRINITY_DN52953_c0_g1_i1.p1 TRINITY_DN52953_c0_g1~~TRINITY_DN52953_c0_g1_i1.p1  ORF type:complete len:155 (+),score=8.91 TRINITY_DN52953_c0_g1_i1:35-499(+)